MSVAEAAAIGARLFQFTGASVLGGSTLFFLYAVTPRADFRWPKLLVGFGAVGGALGTLCWLMAQAAQVGEQSGDAFDLVKVWSLAAETGFGRIALARLGLFLVALALNFGHSTRPRWVVLASLGAVISATFAWTGHGARDEGAAGLLHLAADVVHLLSAAIWIGALAALSLIAWQARLGMAEAGRAVAIGLTRFSAIGLTVVALLVASGLTNSWFLVGADGFGGLLSDTYGQVLVVKLLLFGVMLALAAANRFIHTPRIESALASGADRNAFRAVATTVLVETALALAVLGLVSWLGTLAPSIES